MYEKIKPMLSTSELIEKLKTKNIKFELMSEDEAILYLNRYNYYFKIMSYRKNFDSRVNDNGEETFSNLDFFMLKDLSIIDMKIRRTMMIFCLDIEHFFKVYLLNKVYEHFGDGYTIVKEYFDFLKQENQGKQYDNFISELNNRENSVYSQELAIKYKGDYPIWVIIELTSFGKFVKLFKFIADKIDDSEMNKYAYLLKNVRELRNACAHNNCIINDFRRKDSYKYLDKGLKNFLYKNGFKKTTISTKMSNPRVQQICTLLYLNHITSLSESMSKYNKSELRRLKRRVLENIDIYSKNNLVYSNLMFLTDFIDIMINMD